MTRREFLQRGCRTAAAATMAAAFGWLLGSGKVNTDTDGTGCSRGGICRGCPELDGCRRPEGLSFIKIMDRSGGRA